MRLNQKMQPWIINFRPIFIASSIAISIYLIFINTTQTEPLSSDQVQYNLENLIEIQENRINSQHEELLKIISKPHCGKFPMLTDLNVTDTYWQALNTTNGTFYLFNAYFDEREALKNGSVVRILALINRVEPIVKTHCQFWFEGMNELITVEVREYLMIWPKYWGINDKGAGPYLITCPNPLSNVSLVPQFVSLVEEKCGNANNVMEIRNKKPKNGHKENFLVSVKNLDFLDDVSLLLIEWCEILKIFGVNKVEIFVVNAHPNVLRVLKFYQSQNFIRIKFLKFPHEFPSKVTENWAQWSQNDLVPYHDSFYENLYLYDYMIPMDIDEFIVPIRPEDQTWSGLLVRTIEKSKIKNEIFDVYSATNMYFLLKSIHKNETIPEIPKNLRFLSNIYRSANFTPNGGGSKSFMRTDRILTVHNHFPLTCLENSGYCKIFNIDREDGLLAHYRSDCDNPECQESKPNPIKDTTLWKYKDEILKNVNTTIEELEKFQSDIDSKLNASLT